MSRIRATYLVACPPAAAQARADAIRVEQSVEMPLEGVRDPTVLADIVGQVESITPAADGRSRVVVGLAAATARPGIAQLMNMLFGNTSLHEDVQLIDAKFPEEIAAAFPGPRHGIAGLRKLTGVPSGPITCTALKPQGSSVEVLAGLCHSFARAGMHIIKDDHGLSDQDYSPFEPRLRACQAAVLRANREAGTRALYAPSICGTPTQVFRRARMARDEGVKVMLVAPMLLGLPVFEELVAEHTDCAILAHPAMGGAARIAPPLLFGKLFRMLGADAVIFTGYGGRFAYSRACCRDIAEACRGPLHHMQPAMPVPAGGMRLDRVDELVEFYGQDTLLLIGGDLLIAGERLVERGREFAAAVAGRAQAA